MCKLPYALALALLATACGDDDETKALDCAWLADESNCWREVVAAAQSCLPTETGFFDGDRSSCSFDDGFVIDFAEALPSADIPAEYAWKFEGGRDGASCIEVSTNPAVGRNVFTSPAGRVEFESSRTNGNVSVSCPNGDRYSGSMTNIAKCEDSQLFFAFPGLSQGSAPDREVKFVASGARPADPEGGIKELFGMVTLFTCEDGPIDPA